MADREALRELQGRLADRLQLARADAPSAAWLAIECAGVAMLVPLTSAGEIFPMAPLRPVPHTRHWFLGVANLRGGLHGVVDLAAFLGLRDAPPADPGRQQPRLLAFNPSSGSQCAVLVDRLLGLRSAAQMTAEPTPEVPRPDFAERAWHDADGRRWQEIDLGRLARSAPFLAIAA